MPPEVSQLTDQLPPFQLRDFDVLLNQGLAIGIDSNYASELRVRLSAASLSFQMGNTSIDHFRKQYLKDLSYDQSRSDRLDRRVERFLREEIERLDKILSPLAPESSVLGQMVAKWTFIRIPFSFKLATTCAQRGALFECLAIVRMILEQTAWSLDIRLLDDFGAITSRKSTHSIQTLKLVHPAAGQFYGWLSAHAHWTYDAHIKAFHADDTKIGMHLANSLYKAQALGALLVLFAIVEKGYQCLSEALGLEPLETPQMASGTGSFIREIQSLAPEDHDIRQLMNMIETKHHEG